ncbi:MAG: hypothetical protein AAGF59_05965 [Pseudomonadota bacterium]
MSEAEFRTRIAIGVIHDPEEAQRLIAEFGSRRDAIPALAVVASKRHLGRYANCLKADRETGYNPPPVMVHRTNGDFDAATWRPDALDEGRFRRQLLAFEQWMAPMLVARLKAHLDQRALILAIPIYSADQEQTVCRMLLKWAVDYLYVQDVPKVN